MSVYNGLIFATKSWLYSHLASSFLDDDEGCILYPALHLSPTPVRFKPFCSKRTEKGRQMKEGLAEH